MRFARLRGRSVRGLPGRLPRAVSTSGVESDVASHRTSVAWESGRFTAIAGGSGPASAIDFEGDLNLNFHTSDDSGRTWISSSISSAPDSVFWGGATQASYSSGDNACVIVSYFLNPGFRYLAVYSTDGGESWDTATIAEGERLGPYARLTVDGGGAFKVTIGRTILTGAPTKDFEVTTYSSSDWGASWSTFYTWSGSGVAFAPNPMKTWYGSDGNFYVATTPGTGTGQWVFGSSSPTSYSTHSVGATIANPSVVMDGAADTVPLLYAEAANKLYACGNGTLSLVATLSGPHIRSDGFRLSDGSVMCLVAKGTYQTAEEAWLYRLTAGYLLEEVQDLTTEIPYGPYPFGAFFGYTGSRALVTPTNEGEGKFVVADGTAKAVFIDL